MRRKRKATTQLQCTKNLDYRSPDDDAWYDVRLLKVKEGLLRVMYLTFPEDMDDGYSANLFESMEELNELLGRFRLPAQQLQDSQCGQVTPGMAVLACHHSSNGKRKFYDATVDSVSRFSRKSQGTSEVQVCNCQFHVTWRNGPVTGEHGTVGVEDICLIQDSPVDDPVLQDFTFSAKKSLENRKSSANSNVMDIRESHEATNFQNKSGGEASTELASEGLTNEQKGRLFFWVDNLGSDIDPSKIVKFFKREFSVSTQVVLFPSLFLSNTSSGAIYVESTQQQLLLVSRFLNNPDNIIVSKNGRPWVFNKKCRGSYHLPMPYQECPFQMNLDTESQDLTDIRVRHPGTEGYEEASKMCDLYKAHCDEIEELQKSLRSEELKLCDTLANKSKFESLFFQVKQPIPSKPGAF